MITYCYDIEVVDSLGATTTFYVEIRKEGTTKPGEDEVLLALLRSLYPIQRITLNQEVYED